MRCLYGPSERAGEKSLDAPPARNVYSMEWLISSRTDVRQGAGESTYNAPDCNLTEIQRLLHTNAGKQGIGPTARKTRVGSGLAVPDEVANLHL